MKHFKIALVEAAPKSTHLLGRAYLPRLGMSTIGAILKSRGYKCDLWFKPMSAEEEQRLQQYDIVGISSLTCTIPDAYRLADYLKQTSSFVVMGGPHVTFMPEEALDHCDYVVMGEGDVTFADLIVALGNGEPPDAIPGLVYGIPGDRIHYTGPSEIVEYPSLPSPDFTLSPQLDAGRIPPVVATSRGCPHSCSFCSVTPVFGRRYRFKRNEQVIAELRPILDRSVCFSDDNLCGNTERTKSLLRDMIAQNAVPLRWSGQMCVRTACDNELLELMHETRCRIMYVGIESIPPGALNSYSNSHEADDIRRCVDGLHDHDIGIHGMFMVGSKDGAETVREIVDYAVDTDMDTIQICSLTPFPGTKSCEKVNGHLLHRIWDFYDGIHVVVEPEDCSAYDMQMAIVDGMKRFYSVARVVTSFRHGRGWRLRYRAHGYQLIRKWERENARYIRYLRRNYCQRSLGSEQTVHRIRRPEPTPMAVS